MAIFQCYNRYNKLPEGTRYSNKSVNGRMSQGIFIFEFSCVKGSYGRINFPEAMKYCKESAD
jgi:hypothetical protein